MRWGQNGHRIVAQICFDELNDNAMSSVEDILSDSAYLTQIVTWPDFIRSEKNWDFTKPWHFVTIDPGKTPEQVFNESKADTAINNAMEAIELMKSILKKEKRSIDRFNGLMKANKVKPLYGSVRATALAFLTHFIGDIHQPMHVGKNKDAGGNMISVLFFKERSNLHSVWDSGIIEQEGLSFKQLSDFIIKHTEHKKLDWQRKHRVTEWAKESVQLREKIYNTLYDQTDRSSGLPDLYYQYQHDFIGHMEDRLAAGGYRAAAVLNEIFK